MTSFLRTALLWPLLVLLLLGGGTGTLSAQAQATPTAPVTPAAPPAQAAPAPPVTPDALSNVKAALREGSAKDIAALFGPTVDLGVDGNKQTYSQTQAEFVVRDFFTKNPPVSFEFVHQGASDASTPYAIGRYATKTDSYRVLVKLKLQKSEMVIDNLDFTKE